MEDEEPHTSCQKCKVRKDRSLNVSKAPSSSLLSSCGLLWSWEQFLLPDSVSASPHPCPPMPSLFFFPPSIPSPALISCSPQFPAPSPQIPVLADCGRQWKAATRSTLWAFQQRCPFAISHIHLQGTFSDVGDSPCLPAVLFTSSPLALGAASCPSSPCFSRGWLPALLLGMGGEMYTLGQQPFKGPPWSGPAVRLPRGRGWAVSPGSQLRNSVDSSDACVRCRGPGVGLWPDEKVCYVGEPQLS